MTTPNIEQGLRAKVDPNALIERVTGTVKGARDHGLVMWSRPFPYGKPGAREWIVHRWATRHSDGTPVHGGIMFYSGGYWLAERQALADFAERKGVER